MLYQMHEPPVMHLFGALVDVAVAPVPRNVAGEFLPGIEADATQPQPARMRFGECEQPVADPAALRDRRGRDAPDQEIVRARLEDQHAIEAVRAFGKPDFIR